eukprot:FR741126.1.p1 GENE.FR741126.1~~FR741126.1.p1  ORF type:complete len:150 (+),score=22.37 FR741126.1:2-451(+)
MGVGANPLERLAELRQQAAAATISMQIPQGDRDGNRGGDGGGDRDGVLEAEVTQGEDDQAEAEPPTNPFFVGYSQDDLAALWAVHEQMVVPTETQDLAAAPLPPPTSLPGDASGTTLGSLHDIVRAIAEGNISNEAAPSAQTDGPVDDP